MQKVHILMYDPVQFAFLYQTAPIMKIQGKTGIYVWQQLSS